MLRCASWLHYAVRTVRRVFLNKVRQRPRNLLWSDLTPNRLVGLSIASVRRSLLSYVEYAAGVDAPRPSASRTGPIATITVTHRFNVSSLSLYDYSAILAVRTTLYTDYGDEFVASNYSDLSNTEKPSFHNDVGSCLPFHIALMKLKLKFWSFYRFLKLI